MSEKEDTVRHEILVAAQENFQRFGFKKTTIEDIAESSGKGKSTLYYYFRNKDAIFSAVLWAEWNAVFDEIKRKIKAHPSLEDRLHILIEGKVKGISEFANMYRGLRSDALLKYAVVRDFRYEARKKETDIIAGFLREAVQKGEFRYETEKDVQLVAFTIVSILYGIQETIFRGFDDERFQQPEFIEEVADLVLNGIKK